MTTKTRIASARLAYVQEARSRLKRWSGYVDCLLDACRRTSDLPPRLPVKLEALRDKRDYLEARVRVLDERLHDGWESARREVEDAHSDLRRAWTSVLYTLDRESAFL